MEGALSKVKEVLNPVSCMRYTKDNKNLLGGKCTERKKKAHVGRNNLSLVKMLSLENRIELKLFGSIVTKALKKLMEARSSTTATVASTLFLILGLSLKVNKYYSRQRAHLYYLHVSTGLVKREG